jgi:hypothetical protein
MVRPRRQIIVDKPFPTADIPAFAFLSMATDGIMSSILQPWQLLLLIIAGWVQRQQHEAIDYLRTENQVLKERLGKKRILLDDDDQRRRLAVKAKVLGRKALTELGTIFTPARPALIPRTCRPQLRFPAV